MKFSFDISNGAIRKRAAEIQKRNTWAILGAIIAIGLITGAIASLLGFIGENFGGASANPSAFAAALVLVFSIVSFIVQTLLNMGLQWASVRSVDSGVFSMQDIFLPFQRRPWRNILIMILFSLVIMAIMLVLAGATAGAVFVLLPGFELNPVMAGFPEAVMPLASILSVSFIIYLFAAIYISFMFAIIEYIPYDFNHLGAGQVLSVSRKLMKGNKFKLFRLNLYYVVVPIAIILLLTAIVGFVFYQTENPGLTAILSTLVFIVAIVLVVLMTIRLLIANAVYYRTIFEENAAEIASEIPELNLDSNGLVYTDNPENIYHTEGRPHLNGDAVAVQPRDGGVGSVTDKMANNEATMSDSRQFVTGAGAAAVFGAATNNSDMAHDIKAPAEAEQDKLIAEAIAAGDEQIAANIARDANGEDLKDSKQPYDIMGYNTPERTDFSQVNNKEEVLMAAEAVQEDNIVSLTQDNFPADNEKNSEADIDIRENNNK